MGATVTVTGEAFITDNSTGKALDDSDRLTKVAALHETEELISNYFDDDLSEIEITGGDIKLVLNSDGRTIHVISTFKSPRKLTSAELKLLASDTVGQWSDGIGENCFGTAGSELNVFIDLVQRSKPAVEQIIDAATSQKKGIPRSGDLVKAAEAGDLDKVKELLARGANPNGKNSRENTSMTMAAWRGHVAVIEELVRGGADVNAMDWSGTPLTWASRSADENSEDKIAVARSLLSAGADPNLIKDDWGGRSALSYAVSSGCVDLVKALLAAGANVNLADQESDRPGEPDFVTPLMHSSGAEMAQLLLDAGADSSMRNSSDQFPTAFQYIRRMAKAAGSKTEEGKGRLATAELIEKHRLATIQF